MQICSGMRRCQCSLQELNQHKQAVQFCFEHALFNSLKEWLISVGVAGGIMYCIASALISEGSEKAGEYS